MKKWQIVVLAGVLVVAVVAGAAFLIFGGGKAAATVNGVKIPEAEVEKQLMVIKQSQQGQVPAGAGGEEQEKQWRAQVLSFLINAELIKQEAQELGITVSDKELDKRLKQVKGMFPKQAEFQQALKEQGLTEPELREKIREQILADKMMARVMKGTKISDKDKQKFYVDNKSQFIVPEQRHLRQIAATSKKDAEAILKELEDGADFAELAKEKSADKQTATQGGDIGWVSTDGFPPEFGAALNVLEVDEVSKVVAAGKDRFFVFRLEGIKEKKQQSYKEVADQIEQKLLQDAQQRKFSELIDRLTKEAKIVKS